MIPNYIKKYEDIQKIIIEFGGIEISRKLKYAKFSLNTKIITVPRCLSKSTVIFIEDIETKQEDNFHSLRKPYAVQIEEFKEALPLKCQLQKTNL